MRVLITGITGFVGSHLADFLLQKGGIEVAGIARWRSRMDNVSNILDRIQLVECDLRDETSVKAALERIRPDHIFHLAGQSFVPTSWHSPRETFTINVLGTLNIFEAVRSLDLQPRIQVAGSSEEYGLVHPDEVPVKETNPLRPLSPYAVSKAAADLLSYQYFMSYRLHVVRTRAFNHEGPRRGDVFVTSNFAKQIVEAELGLRPPVIHVGNLEAQRDYTDVRDVVRAYWSILEKGAPGEVYNICSGEAWSIQRVLDTLLGMSKVKMKVERDPARMRPSDVPLLVGDSHKMRALTGWKPSIPFEKTLGDTLDYWRTRLGHEQKLRTL